MKFKLRIIVDDEKCSRAQEPGAEPWAHRLAGGSAWVACGGRIPLCRTHKSVNEIYIKNTYTSASSTAEPAGSSSTLSEPWAWVA